MRIHSYLDTKPTLQHYCNVAYTHETCQVNYAVVAYHLLVTLRQAGIFPDNHSFLLRW